MGLFDRLSVVVRAKLVVQANLNEMIEKAENPEMVLEQYINDIRKALIETRLAIAKIESIPNQKAKLNYDVAMAEVSKWQENLRKAQKANNEQLTFYASERLKNHQVSANVAKSQVDKNTDKSHTLKQNIATLEKKLIEAENLMNRLNFGTTLTNPKLPNSKDSRFLNIERRLQSLELELKTTRQQLLKQQKVIAKLMNSNSNALKAVSQLLIELNTGDTEKDNNQPENIVLDIQVNPPSLQELLGKGLEDQFDLLELGSDVDDELAAMKAQLVGNPQSLPTQEEKKTSSLDSIVDAEEEALQKQIDEL